MKSQNVNWKAADGQPQQHAQFNFAETLKEAIEQAGSERIVLNHYNAKVKIALQQYLRTLVKGTDDVKGIAPAKASAKANEFAIPEGASIAADPVAKHGKAIENMDAAQLKAAEKAIKAAIKAAKEDAA